MLNEIEGLELTEVFSQNDSNFEDNIKREKDLKLKATTKETKVKTTRWIVNTPKFLFSGFILNSLYFKHF